jgi:GYF domain 2
MAAQWYCRLMGTELGPFTSNQLLEMARSHRLMPDDSVKKEADGMWVAAHRVKGLFDDASASTIIMASLPPEVKQALESKQEATKVVAVPEPRPIKWYFISDQNKVGPLSFDELVAHGREGLIKPKTRVWSSKSPKWCEAKDVEGLVFGQPREELRT